MLTANLIGVCLHGLKTTSTVANILQISLPSLPTTIRFIDSLESDSSTLSSEYSSAQREFSDSFELLLLFLFSSFNLFTSLVALSVELCLEGVWHLTFEVSLRSPACSSCSFHTKWAVLLTSCDYFFFFNDFLPCGCLASHISLNHNVGCPWSSSPFLCSCLSLSSLSSQRVRKDFCLVLL